LNYTRDCAKEIDADFTLIEQCATSHNGQKLLKDSIARTNYAKVEASCTVYIDGKQRCIRDGEWYECPDGHEVEDFVRMVEEAYYKRADDDQDNWATK